MKTLGIDPGLANTGIALIEGRTVLFTEVLRLKTMQVGEAVAKTLTKVRQEEYDGTAIERFASYGTAVGGAEQISYFIGGLVVSCREPFLIRAIDWKTQVSQTIYLEGYRNPSTALDKKFSLSAAEFVFDQKFKTDHEADAALLAFWRTIPKAKNSLVL